MALENAEILELDEGIEHITVQVSSSAHLYPVTRSLLLKSLFGVR